MRANCKAGTILKGSLMNVIAHRNLLLAISAASLLLPVGAQTLASAPLPEAPVMVASYSSSADSATPEAPPAMLRTYVPAADADAAQGGTPAPRYAKYISPNEKAESAMSTHDKIIMGFRDLYSPLTLAGITTSAGYGQLVNGSPNYGVDRGAFGQRLGAAGIRDASQGLFADAILAPALHMDTRYYIQGSDHSFMHRTVYSVTRVFVGRTDSGRNTVNAPLLIAYAGSAALNNAYYPPINRNFKDTASEFAGSIGGAALGFFVSEFSGTFLKALHLSK